MASGEVGEQRAPLEQNQTEEKKDVGVVMEQIRGAKSSARYSKMAQPCLDYLGR